MSGERNAEGMRTMPAWVLPIAGYVGLLGAAGITSKLALETIDWRQLILWVPICYLVVGSYLVLVDGVSLPLGRGGMWAAVTGICAAGSLILLFVSLSRGEAGVVVPVSSAYPVVTLAGGALFLSESITVSRVIGVLLVIGGVVVLSR